MHGSDAISHVVAVRVVFGKIVQATRKPGESVIGRYHHCIVNPCVVINNDVSGAVVNLKQPAVPAPFNRIDVVEEIIFDCKARARSGSLPRMVTPALR